MTRRIVGGIALLLGALLGVVACGEEKQPEAASSLTSAELDGTDTPTGEVAAFCMQVEEAAGRYSITGLPPANLSEAEAKRRLRDLANGAPVEIRTDMQVIAQQYSTRKKASEQLGTAATNYLAWLIRHCD